MKGRELPLSDCVVLMSSYSCIQTSEKVFHGCRSGLFSGRCGTSHKCHLGAVVHACYWSLFPFFIFIRCFVLLVFVVPNDNVAYLLPARTAEPQKWPFANNIGTSILQPPVSLLRPLIISLHGLHGKLFPSVVLECVSIGLLPSNGWLSNVESVIPGLYLPSRCRAMVVWVTILSQNFN